MTNIFLMDCNNGSVVNVDKNVKLSTYKAFPTWPDPLWCGSFTAGGSVTMLMLRPEDNYTAEIATFGGVDRSDVGECPMYYELPVLASWYR
jgi:hypothetical protein